MARARYQELAEEFLRGRIDRRELMRRGAALGVGASVLTAAGGVRTTRVARAQDAPADLSGELTFWHGLGTEAAVVNDTVIPAFQQQFPDVKVNVLQVPFDQLQNKYNTEASAGGGPDVLLGPPDWVGQYVEADVIKSLGDLADEDFRAGYNEAALGLFTFEDELYAVPQNINGVGLFYNKQLVQTPPATTDELKATASELGGTQGQYGLGIFGQFYNNAAYLYGFGGQALTEDGESGFDSPEAVEWLTFLQDLAKTPGVFVGTDQNSAESLFKEGKLGMMFNGPWFVQGATEGVGEENVGVAKLPAIGQKDNAPARPFVGGTGLYINANLDDDQAQLAFEFAKWFSTTGTQPLVEEAGQIPAAKAVQVPPEDPYLQTWIEQYADGVPLPNDPKMSAVWTPADDMIAKVLRGDAAPEEAAKDAAETINKAGS